MCGAVSKNAQSTATRIAFGCHSQQKSGQQTEGRRNCGCRQRDDAKLTSNCVGSCKCDLREPLQRNPVCRAKVCRERVGSRNRVVIKNPATKRKMRISVGIRKQARS